MARRGDGIYKRGKTWWLDFVHRGERHVERIGKGINRTVVGEIASVRRGAILKGDAGIGRKRKDLPFDEAQKLVMAWAASTLKANSVESYRRCFKKLAAFFGGKRLGEISPFLVEKYKQERVTAGAKVRVNRELAALKSTFNRCREWGKFEGENPVEKVKMRKEARGSERFIDHEQEAKILAVAGEPLRTILLTGIYGGLRLEAEALSLRWSGVDLQRRLLTVEAGVRRTASGERCRSTPDSVRRSRRFERALQKPPNSSLQPAAARGRASAFAPSGACGTRPGGRQARRIASPRLPAYLASRLAMAASTSERSRN